MYTTPALIDEIIHLYLATDLTAGEQDLDEDEFINIAYKENLSLVKIRLKTGRSHQIRVQFSSRNMPLWGDQKYNDKSVVGEQIALFASSLSFEHPVSKEKLTFSLDLPKRYPWNKFF